MHSLHILPHSDHCAYAHKHTDKQHFNAATVQVNLVALWFSVSSHCYPEHPNRTGQNSSYPNDTSGCISRSYINDRWFWSRSFYRPDAKPKQQKQQTNKQVHLFKSTHEIIHMVRKLIIQIIHTEQKS